VRQRLSTTGSEMTAPTPSPTRALWSDFCHDRRLSCRKAPPGAELKDYEEYAHLYKLAWSDPANRWLLSTLPAP
jgi:hypothetical protein